MYTKTSTWSDMGCFSMPEYSAERFSYLCPPFSVIEQLLGAIYAKWLRG
jgi:hypothetical protein